MTRMTRDNGLELARHGDPNAIAALINRSLQRRGITATAQLDGDTLQLDLESERILAKPAIVNLMRQGLTQLRLQSVRQVQLNARQTGNPEVIWQHRLDLSQTSTTPPQVEQAQTPQHPVPATDASELEPVPPQAEAVDTPIESDNLSTSQPDPIAPRASEEQSESGSTETTVQPIAEVRQVPVETTVIQSEPSAPAIASPVAAPIPQAETGLPTLQAIEDTPVLEEEMHEESAPRSIVVTTPPGEISVAPRYRSPHDPSVGSNEAWQLIVGELRLDYTPQGIKVNPLMATGNRPMMIPRSTPEAGQYCRPINLLDRKREVELATRSLQSTSPVELYGETGLGKTALLRAIAHNTALTELFPDGVVYRSVRQLPLEDLTQSLFAEFVHYDSSIPAQPTEADIRYALRGKQALVLLDDVDWTQDDLDGLANRLPSLTFLATASDRHLWGENQAIPLAGLPLVESLALIQQGLGRSLQSDEQYLAETLCRRLQGHPLRLLQMTALIRERQVSFNSVTELLRTWTAEELMLRFSANLPEPERRILAVLALVDGLPLQPYHLGALVALMDVAPVIQRLEQLSLIGLESDGYALAGNLIHPIRRAWNLGQWLQRVTTYFTRWASQQPPEGVLAIAPILLHLMQQTTAQSRWPEVIQLGRLLDATLAYHNQWATWEQVLQHTQQAAVAANDPDAIAWTHHQLGTRALCLEDRTTALAELTQALQIRDGRGDAAAAVTRHNVHRLAPPPRDEDPLVESVLIVSEPRSPLSRLHPLLVPAAIAVGGLVVAALAIWRPFTPQAPPIDISLSQGSVDFGGQLVNTKTNDQTIELKNDGATPLAIAKLSLSGDHAADFQVMDNCTAQPLPPGEDCEIVVSFTPQDVGDRSAELQLTDANGKARPIVVLNGRGTAARGPIALTFEPGSVDFGDQAVGVRSSAKTITVKNTGTAALNIRAVSPLGEHKDDFSSQNNCTGVTLAPGQTCQLQVIFEPDVAGNRVASLVVAGYAADPGPVQAQQLWNIALSGRGASTPVIRGNPGTMPTDEPILPPPSGAPGIELSGDRLLYGNVPVGQRSDVQSVIIGNPGTTPLQFSDIRIVSNDDHSPFVVTENSCGDTLAANWECRISVQFVPQTPGDFRATLMIPSGAAGAQAVDLSGTGLPPETTGGTPQILVFSASPQAIGLGGTVNLCYRITNAERAYIDGIGGLDSVSDGCIQVQPTQNTTYTLVAVGGDDVQVSQSVDVTVRAALQPPTSLRPGNPDSETPQGITCRNGVTLAWQPASTDAARYSVTLQYLNNQNGWATAVELTPTAPSVNVTDWLWETYTSAWRWQVATVNGTGDRSSPSSWQYLACTDNQ